MARPESVESGLRAAANPAAPFARPALPPSRPPPSARPYPRPRPAPHGCRRLRRRHETPPTSPPSRRRLHPRPLHSRLSQLRVAQAPCHPAGHKRVRGSHCARVTPRRGVSEGGCCWRWRWARPAGQCRGRSTREPVSSQEIYHSYNTYLQCAKDGARHKLGGDEKNTQVTSCWRSPCSREHSNRQVTENNEAKYPL